MMEKGRRMNEEIPGNWEIAVFAGIFFDISIISLSQSFQYKQIELKEEFCEEWEFRSFFALKDLISFFRNNSLWYNWYLSSLSFLIYFHWTFWKKFDNEVWSSVLLPFHNESVSASVSRDTNLF